jgi:bla regulator protein blaR1
VTHWLFASLLATSLLLSLVLLLRGPVLRTFGPKIAYSLWALPAARMVLPPLPIPSAALPKVVALQPVTAGTAAGGADLVELLGLLWACGAVLWFCCQMVRYRVFLARALEGATRLTSECGVDVLVSPAVTGPMATGVISRRILLPVDFRDRYTSEERRMALLHEGAHHDRRDILANFMALGFVAAHWWNPLAHIAYRRFRADQELACDATVLSRSAPGGDRQTYGSALLKSASAPLTTVACALSHKDEVRKRIVTMMHPGFGLGRRITGMGGALSLIVAGAALTATAQAAPPSAMRDLSGWFAPAVHNFGQASRDMEAESAEMARFVAENRREAAQMTRKGRATDNNLDERSDSAAKVMTSSNQANPSSAMRDMSGWFASAVQNFDGASRDMRAESAEMARLAAKGGHDAAQMQRVGQTVGGDPVEPSDKTGAN